jgi:uncharacterized protein (DUF1330 family)
MSAYIVAEVTITNEEQMKAYREWSTRAIQEFQAEVLVRGGTVVPLEENWAPQRVVILRFPDLATAQAYYHSATYTKARQVRQGAGTIRMFAVEGV